MQTLVLDHKQTVAELVLEHSECAEVLQRHHIDYCCRGNVSIDAAAKAKGIDSKALVDELAAAINNRHTEPLDLRALPTPRLISHIVVTHHEYLRKALPFIAGLAAKVSRVHGDHNPKLVQLAGAVDELSALLIPHLDEEERALFPALMSPTAQPYTQWQMLLSMEEEHRGVARLLERIAAYSDELVAPDWACASYRTLMLELVQLQTDVHVHVHLENHLLKPRFAMGDDAVRREEEAK